MKTMGPSKQSQSSNPIHPFVILPEYQLLQWTAASKTRAWRQLVMTFHCTSCSHTGSTKSRTRNTRRETDTIDEKTFARGLRRKLPPQRRPRAKTALR
ncbi:hypothetical protein HZ326_28921 [Fusarium oxysporum f. sp. albedinis]|nr:hypothetical protein HZ326_28921 [Fusarium oxysporum f. sp. albedinis]